MLHLSTAPLKNGLAATAMVAFAFCFAVSPAETNIRASTSVGPGCYTNSSLSFEAEPSAPTARGRIITNTAGVACFRQPDLIRQTNTVAAISNYFVAVTMHTALNASRSL
jgi:hypothetical protein